MIRVMYIVNESEPGGAAQSLLDMLAVSNGEIDPTVIIPAAGRIEEWLGKSHITYYIVPFETDHRKIGEHSRREDEFIFQSNYRAALELQEIVGQRGIQIIHTNSSVCNVGAFLALMTGLPHIWHIRELVEEHYGCEFVDNALKRKLFGCADKIVSISHCVSKIYKDKYGVDCKCIYDGLHIERFIETESFEKEADSFLMAGHITPAKGQMDAIKAVRELARQGIETYLYIVGPVESDYYRWFLHRCIKQYGLEQNIRILAYRKDLRKLRRRCRYSITGSKMEALGRVTVEAMLAGCVVIGADTGGTAEIIGQDGSRGYLYRQGNYQDLARVMRYAVEHADRNRSIQRAAQDFAVKKFDAEKYVEKMAALYEDVLRDRERSAVTRNKELSDELQERYNNVKDMDADTDSKSLACQNSGKNQMLAEMIRQWFAVKLEKKSLETVLLRRDIRSAAIYGMGYLGRSLYQELEDSSVEIAYVMDQALEDKEGILRIIRLEEELPKADAVIVTVLGDVRALCDLIRNKCGYPVITLKNLLDWCEEEL